MEKKLCIIKDRSRRITRIVINGDSTRQGVISFSFAFLYPLSSYIYISAKSLRVSDLGLFAGVPSMELSLLVKVQSRVFTAKCSEPQVGASNGMDEGSGMMLISDSGQAGICVGIIREHIFGKGKR